jgi:lycopene cyclase domain-containing protein
MQQYAYIIALVVSLFGLYVIDRKYKLAFFWNWRLTLGILVAGIIFFLGWDIAGVVLGVFSTNQDWVTGLYVITPDLPIEEFLFLTLLNYQVILFWRWRCLRT